MTQETHLYADVALPLPIDKSFCYAVPPPLSGAVKPGTRVVVPFGPKRMSGYVLSTGPAAAGTGGRQLKEVLELVDDEPVVSEELFALSRWISANYLCTLGEALATAVPLTLKKPLRAPRAAAPRVRGVDEPHALYPKPELTPGQKEVVLSVEKEIAAENHEVFLLHGVTGSGKTEVYLALIEKVLSGGKTAVFLLPEISLTPQFITIVRRRFPGIVGIWHSKLSAGERYRTWDAARNGEVRIMIGARSALFAPFQKLGLIIVDEEHEPSYKQEQKPSYQTRDVAIERARLNSAVVLFGSATPSLELYYRARSGGIRLLELPERIDNRPLPGIRIVDPSLLRAKAKILTEELKQKLTRTLARREQAILFLNRRGFSPGIMCQNCGKVWECPRCSVSLVFHKHPESLRCHYCDHNQDWPGICPSCKSTNISIFGVGTQKVEEEIKRQFPQGRVFRLDRDTASKKGVYEQAYRDFKDEQFDILLGTQMVAKGFDFPRVTLVGVVDADTALYLPDFRSAERTFQLITQVAGRCGRGELAGEVVVQSCHSGHYALAAAQKHDYKDFYAQEIEFRRQTNYPPFCSLVNLLLRGKNEEKVAEAAKKLGEGLPLIRQKHGLKFEFLGPAQAAYYKLHNLFRYQALLKGERPMLIAAAKAVREIALPSGVLLSIDVDPQDTL